MRHSAKTATSGIAMAAAMALGIAMMTTPAAAGPSISGMGDGSLGYRFGTSLTQFKNMKLPFKGLPKGATVKCGNDPDLQNRMVGYIARDEARYESVGVVTCRVVAPDPANLSWWRPVEFEVDGVKSRLRFDFMEVAGGGNGPGDTAASESFDDTGFADALYGGNDLSDPGSEYALVAARVSPVRAKDGYKLMASLNQRLGGSTVKRDRVEIAPGIAFKMDVPTWQRGNLTVAAWDPTELGHYDLVFTMTSAKDTLQARLDDIE